MKKMIFTLCLVLGLMFNVNAQISCSDCYDNTDVEYDQVQYEHWLNLVDCAMPAFQQEANLWLAAEGSALGYGPAAAEMFWLIYDTFASTLPDFYDCLAGAEQSYNQGLNDMLINLNTCLEYCVE